MSIRQSAHSTAKMIVHNRTYVGYGPLVRAQIPGSIEPTDRKTIKAEIERLTKVIEATIRATKVRGP
jgi:hypothetical protein